MLLSVSHFLRHLPVDRTQTATSPDLTADTDPCSVPGYSKQHVRQIQEQAAERKTNPARLLIADWAKRSDATAASFVHALTMIGRRDLAGLVSPKPVRLTVANVDNFV